MAQKGGRWRSRRDRLWKDRRKDEKKNEKKVDFGQVVDAPETCVRGNE